MTDAELRMARRLATKRNPSAQNIDSLIEIVPRLVEEIEQTRSELAECRHQQNQAGKISDVGDKMLGLATMAATAAAAERDTLTASLATARATIAELEGEVGRLSIRAATLRRMYGVSETQHEADCDQYDHAIETRAAEQIAAWLETTHRLGSTGNVYATNLAHDIRVGLWRKESK